jgi:seryl-tRNA synthetase
MHDLREIRRDPDGFLNALRRRDGKIEIGGLLSLDDQHREVVNRLDEMRRERNSISRLIGERKKKGEDTSPVEADMRRLGDEISAGEANERTLAMQIHDRLLEIPNRPADSTPDGLDSSGNIVINQWGKIQPPDFQLLDHLAIAERLGILDFARGGKIAGSGFPVWSGWGAVLERALINFMLELHTTRHGYREMMTPFLANYESMRGSGQIPKLEADMYRCRKTGKEEDDTDDLFLIPTSEVTLVNLHRSEMLDEKELPIKYTAYSPCFRREAGAYGHLTRGFLRVHQFNKVEMVRFERPEDSAAALDELVLHAGEVLRQLELPYRVVQLCAGDLGFNAAICYDLEVWAPAEKQWLEVSSCSNCMDFQARRANIRFRRSGGKSEFVHTLNGSGLATSRLMVALLETYQTAESSLAVPSVLRKYMGGKTVVTGNQQ